MTTIQPGLKPATASSIRTEPSVIFSDLLDRLGAVSVAALAGARDAKTVYRWARPDGVRPREASFRRAIFAHEQWERITTASEDFVARAWFIAANQHLGYETPVAAIGRDEFKKVASALDAFHKELV
ncbi:hypothetical protein [Leifsonia xyli]|uniref:hypothetical protein n=1 Tax=Leifsonia xyli TaxID=1575 RepID=UPI003D6692DA